VNKMVTAAKEIVKAVAPPAAKRGRKKNVV
jgi:hypothetical protein